MKSKTQMYMVLLLLLKQYVIDINKQEKDISFVLSDELLEKKFPNIK